MPAFAGFSPIARGLIVAAAIAVLVMCLKAASPIIAPILLAMFIAMIATPSLHWMLRKGMPKYLALAIFFLVMLDVSSVVAMIVTGALEGLRGSLPTYQQRVTFLYDQLGRWLENIGIENSRNAIPDLLDPAMAARMVRAMLASASGSFATLLLVLLIAVFMLAEAPKLPTKLREAFGITTTGEVRLQRLLQATRHYMSIKCLTSLATGVCIGIWLWILKIDFAVLWAVLAFLLNFVPYVGSVFMAVPAILVSLVQYDFPTAILVAIGFVVVNIVIGSILEPRILGRGLGISPLAILLSLLFWGWVLGAVGVFLSVPLTMALIIALDASPRTRPLAVMLGPEIDQSEIGEG